LPKESSNAFVLHFTGEVAVYKPNLEEQTESTPELQRAKHMQSFMNPPKPELKRVYYDLKNKKKLEEMDFMTRVFLVESDIEEPAWKLIPNKKKILGHLCIGAEMIIGENTVTAWFTPKIPVSIGPDMFLGLPGLILMIELNGEKSIVATSVSSDVPEIGKKEDMFEGKVLSKKQFDKIVEEKVEEYKKNMNNRRPGFHSR
jgi:GLPGLI family protein